MLCEITLGYDYSNQKVAITPCEDFDSLPAIYRAEALKGVLHDLTTMYNETVQQIGKEAA